MIGDFLTVIRYFIVSVLIVGVLQIEMKGQTLESHATDWFYSSPIPHHIRTAAQGGAHLIETGLNSTKKFFRGTFNSSSSNIDKASR